MMKNRYLFLILSVLFLFGSFLFQEFLLTDDLVYNFYSEQFADEQIRSLIKNQNYWDWFGYFLIPFIIIIRSVLVALCIEVGLFFYNSENAHKFKQIINITLIAEFILVTIIYVKFIYFSLIKTNYSLKEIQSFIPLSYVNFLNIDDIQPWLIYPLQTINLFEITYFFMLVYGLHKLLKNEYVKSFEIVAVSYGLGLLIWLGFVMFLTLNIN